MSIRNKLLQSMYELMCNEYNVHNEVDEKFKSVTELTCKDISETSDEYEKIMKATCELERTAFFAGASMVLEFISGMEAV